MPRSKKPTKFSITVAGRPVPKGRPRLGRRGRVFTPEKTLIAEDTIRGAWLAADGPVFEGPVYIEVWFNEFETVITVGLDDNTEASKLRGDIDNYVKTVMDGLNEAAWLDDKQVHHVKATKLRRGQEIICTD